MITVVLPVRDQGDLLSVVMAAIEQESEPVRTLIFDNGSGFMTRALIDGYVGSKRAEVIDAEGMSLYAMWNAGWQMAGTDAEVAFLNSDIDFHPGTLHHMAEALRAYPKLGAVCPDYRVQMSDRPPTCGKLERVKGSYRHGGLCGWCFMVRGSLDLRVDESFEWWCGDDDLFFQVDAAGYELAILSDLALDHVGEASARHFPELDDAKDRDLRRVRAKWGA